jgi:ABC-type branched-subunit amino acid transport system ATPase component
MEEKTMLKTQNVTKRFGGLVAVDNVSLEVEKGVIHGLIGPNGSGKTTLLNLINGLYPIDSGSIHLDGKKIDGLSSYDIAMCGLTRTFQITKLFKNMTVLENMLVPGLATDTFHSTDDAKTKALELLELVQLERLKDLKSKNLSGGQQKLLELSRALMMDPKIILVDEPFQGVNPVIREELEDLLKGMNKNGLTILIVSHDVPCVMGLCDTISVLASGSIICEGDSDHIRRDHSVIEAYLGD